MQCDTLPHRWLLFELQQNAQSNAILFAFIFSGSDSWRFTFWLIDHCVLYYLAAVRWKKKYSKRFGWLSLDTQEELLSARNLLMIVNLSPFTVPHRWHTSDRGECYWSQWTNEPLLTVVSDHSLAPLRTLSTSHVWQSGAAAVHWSALLAGESRSHILINLVALWTIIWCMCWWWWWNQAHRECLINIKSCLITKEFQAFNFLFIAALYTPRRNELCV